MDRNSNKNGEAMNKKGKQHKLFPFHFFTDTKKIYKIFYVKKHCKK